jgi:hypothetical protein
MLLGITADTRTGRTMAKDKPKPTKPEPTGPEPRPYDEPH